MSASDVGESTTGAFGSVSRTSRWARRKADRIAAALEGPSPEASHLLRKQPGLFRGAWEKPG